MGEFVGASIIGLSLALVATYMEIHIWWWSHAHKNLPEDFLAMLVFIATRHLLPALFIVVYYQRRSKGDETKWPNQSPNLKVAMLSGTWANVETTLPPALRLIHASVLIAVR